MRYKHDHIGYWVLRGVKWMWSFLRQRAKQGAKKGGSKKKNVRVQTWATGSPGEADGRFGGIIKPGEGRRSTFGSTAPKRGCFKCWMKVDKRSKEVYAEGKKRGLRQKDNFPEFANWVTYLHRKWCDWQCGVWRVGWRVVVGVCNKNETRVQSWKAGSGKITGVEQKRLRGSWGSPERRSWKSLICDPSVLTCTLLWLVPRRGGEAEGEGRGAACVSVTECAGLRAKALAYALWPENQPNQPHALTPPGETPMTYRRCDHVIDWENKKKKNTHQWSYRCYFLWRVTVSWFLLLWRPVCFWSFGEDTGTLDL